MAPRALHVYRSTPWCDHGRPRGAFLLNSQRRLHIGVMGAGAIGCYVGGRLAASGTTDVTLVGRAPLGQTIREHGLTIRELERDEHVDASGLRFETEPEALASCDVVLFCVKSGATEESARALAPIVRRDAVVVSLQNGVRNPETLRTHLDGRVVPGIVTFNVIAHDRAVFQKSTSGPIIVEAGDARNGPWVEAMRRAGLKVETVDEIAPEQWTKLLINLSNAVNALAGVPTRQMVLSRDYRRVIAAVLDEALDVLDAANVRTARFRGVPLRVMAFVLRRPTPIVRVFIRAQLRIDPEARSSMWQDLTRRRPTEIEFLNGEIVQLAEAHGIDAPINRRIVALIHDAETAGAGSPHLGAGVLLQGTSSARTR